MGRGHVGVVACLRLQESLLGHVGVAYIHDEWQLKCQRLRLHELATLRVP